jgi:hypothetical protein
MKNKNAVVLGRRGGKAKVNDGQGAESEASHQVLSSVE